MSSTIDTDARRSSILEAAKKLLIRRGYQDFVLDDLAKEAGVAKGTLFLYFKTKDDLVFAALGDMVDRLGQTLEALAKSDRRGEALLEEAVRAILGHFDRNSDFLAQFGMGRFAGCGDRSCGRLMEKLAKNMKRLAAILRRVESGGKIRFKDPDWAAAVIFGLCRSALLYRRLAGQAGPLEGRSKRVVEQFLHGAGGRRP